MFGVQGIARSTVPMVVGQPRPVASQLTAVKPLMKSDQNQLKRTSQTVRDMRTHAQPDNFEGFEGFSNWESQFFQSNPADEDRLKALEFNQLMNDHLELFDHRPKRDAGGLEPAAPEHLCCIISPDVDLKSALHHLDSKARLLTLAEMKYFTEHEPTKELLLAGKGGQFPKLTVADQKALGKAVQGVLPEAVSDEKDIKLDPRNRVLLIQQGTKLEDVKSQLITSYPIPITKDAWRDFTRCIPNDDGIVNDDLAVNTWPLFDLCIQNACTETKNSHPVSQMMPLYEWMLSGQQNNTFSESDVANCRARIIEQATANFIETMVKRGNGLGEEGSALIENFGLPILERSILSRLFSAEASDEVFDEDIYSGSKEFTHWVEQASPGILSFCDRSKPISIVSPNDDRWQALGISNQDLPLVRVNPDVSNSDIKEFLIGLGGSQLETFGLVGGMSVFGSEESRHDSEDRVFSIAKMRNQLVSQFMMQLMVNRDVALAKEFHQKMTNKGFPHQVLSLTRARYENTVRAAVGQLFEENNKPMLLFSVPKLHDFVTKMIDYSLEISSIRQYASQGLNRQSPVETLLAEHLREVDQK